MENNGWMSIAVFGLIVIALCLLILFIRRSKQKDSEYDERQRIGRGQAYKWAFFMLLAYSLVWSCLEASGLRWLEPGVGQMIGIFAAVTVFALVAICHDALVGLQTKEKSALLLWCLIIVVQLFCFVADCVEGSVLRNGLLTHSVVSLMNAVCFLLILIVYLVHRRKTGLPEDEE